jgi:GNAT superfamily N-acetyltransferase
MSGDKAPRGLMGASMRAYNPTLREKAVEFLASHTGDDREAVRRWQTVLGGGPEPGWLDVTPLALPFLAEEAGRRIGTPGQRVGGGLDLALAAVPVPGAVKKGAKGLMGSSARKAVTSSVDDVVARAAERGVSLSLQDGSRGLTLSKIVVPQEARGQGLGSQVMRDVLDYADANQQRVMLTPSDHFGGSVPRLKRFYDGFGFVQNKGRSKDYSISEAMYRDPTPKAPK